MTVSAKNLVHAKGCTEVLNTVPVVQLLVFQFYNIYLKFLAVTFHLHAGMAASQFDPHFQGNSFGLICSFLI